MRAVIHPRSWVVDLWSQVPLERPDGHSPTPLTPAEEWRILAQLDPEDKDRMRLAIVLGLRRAQLFTIRWEHILWKSKALALPTVKKQRARFIPLPHEARRVLAGRWRLAERPEQGWVFPHATNKALPEDAGSWYKYRFKPAVTRAGLHGKKITFHSTRHTFAVRFLEAGGHVRQLQKAGGWSSLSQVEIYTQVQDEGLRVAMNQAAKVGKNRRNLQKR